MRQILVDHARARAANKRGGDAERVPLVESLRSAEDPQIDLIAIEEALGKVEAIDPRLCQVVEMLFFGALTVEEIAAVLGVDPRTVKRDWAAAMTLLYQALGGERERPES
jgi:RNA polymerase sigma factor (TIGR02999 family)